MTTKLKPNKERTVNEALLDLSLSFGDSKQPQFNAESFLKEMSSFLDAQYVCLFHDHIKEKFYSSKKLSRNKLLSINWKPHLLLNDYDHNIVSGRTKAYKQLQEIERSTSLQYHLIKIKNGHLLIAGEEHDLVLYNKVIPVIKKFSNYLQLSIYHEYNSANKTDDFDNYFEFFEKVNFGLVVINEGKFTRINEVFSEITGYSVKELKAKTPYDLFHPEDIDFVSKEIQKLKAKKTKDITVSHRMIRKDGQVIFVKAKINAKYSSDGRYIGDLVSVQDLTQLIDYKEELKSREALLASIFENVPDDIFMVDCEGKLIIANEASYKSMKKFYNRKLKVGEYLFTKNEHPDFVKHFESAVKGKDCTFYYETPRFNDKTETRQSLIKITCVKDSKDLILGALISARDVTKELTKTKELEESEATLKAVLESSTENIFMVDTEQRLLLFNQGSKNAFKTTFDFDFRIGDKVFGQLNNARRKKYTSLMNEALSGKTISFPFNTNFGEKKYSLVTFSPVTDAKGKIIGGLSQTKDVTEIKKNEIAIKERENTLITVLNNSQDGIVAFGTDYKIFSLNSQVEAGVFSKNGKNLSVGTHINHLFGRTEFKALESKYIKKALKGQSINFTTNRGELILDNILSPFVGTSGKIEGCLLTIRDVSEVSKKAEALRENQATLESLFNSTDDQIIAFDLDYNIIAVNEMAIKGHKLYFGADLKNGINLKQVYDKKGFERRRKEYYLPTIKQGSSQRFEKRIQETDSNKYYDISFDPIIDSEGRLIGILETGRDITQRKSKEIEIEKREATMKAVLDSTPNGIYALDHNMEVLAINQKAVEDFENFINVKLKVGDNLNGKVPAKDLKRWRDNYYDKVLEGETKVYNGSTEDRFGNEFFIENHYTPVVDKENKIIGCLEISRDVTSIVKSDAALKDSERKYKMLVDTSPTGISWLNLKGENIFVSGRSAEIFGYTKEERNGKSVMEVIHKEDHDLVKEAIAEMLHSEGSIKKVFKAIHKSGKQIWIEGLGKTIHDAEGNVDSILFVYNDVTDAIEAQLALEANKEELRKQNAIYEALIKNSFDGIDVVEITKVSKKAASLGRLLIRNNRMKEFFNGSNDVYLDSNKMLEICDEIQPNGINSIDFFESNSRKLYKERTLKHNWRLKSENGFRDIKVSNQLIEVDDKLLLLRNYSDITETVEQQEIIERQLKVLNGKNEELERYIDSNLQLENFAYIASHDLKAPLRTVGSFSKLLKMRIYNDLDDKAKHYLSIINESAHNMQLLIDDLLKFSRVNSQSKLAVDLNLKDAISRILLELHTTIAESNTKVIVGEMPKSIYADSSMMIQLFQNLIRNAIKFKKDEVTPIINIDASEDPEFWYFKVSDNGIGISEENKEKIFKIFEKLHSNDIYEGNGLGLTICRKIVEKHQGKIWVKSELGVGSEFNFSLKKP